MQDTKNQQGSAKFRHRRFILSGAALFTGTVMLTAFFTAPASLASGGGGGGDGAERDQGKKNPKEKRRQGPKRRQAMQSRFLQQVSWG